MTSQADPYRWLRGWRAWVTGFAFWTIVGLLAFLYQYLDIFVRAETEPFYEKLIEELTGSYGAGLLFPFIVRYVRHLRSRGYRWYAIVAAQVGALPIYSIAHTTWNWTTRELAYTIFAPGNYDYGIMSFRYVMEFPNDVIDYAIFATLIYLFDHFRAAQDRETRMAHLQTELTKARLRALESQLHPHFLFNALNTVSSVMHKNIAAADTMLSQLGDLLRRTLQTSETHEIPLRSELQTLELYLDIMRARFADRLEVTLDVETGTENVAVPQLLLQPIVENALRHGDPGRGHIARVAISATRQDGNVVLRVEDNGAGISESFDQLQKRGVGLRNTARRLEHLYGNRHAVTLENRPTGGLAVTITIPFHQSESTESN